MNLFPYIENLYLFIIDMTAGLVDMILLIRLYYKIYGDSAAERKKVYLLGIGLFIISAVGYRLLVTYFRPTAIQPVTVAFSFILLPFFKQSTKSKRLLFGFILLAMSALLLLVLDMILSPLNLEVYLIVELIPNICFWIILEFIGYTGRRKRQKIPPSMYLLMGIISVSSIVIFFSMMNAMLTRAEDVPYHWEIITVALLFFVNLALFVLFERLAAYSESEREKALLKQQIELQQSHYNQIEELQNQIRTLHHDMKNHLHTAAALVSGESQRAIRCYLKDAVKQLQAYEEVVTTGNNGLDTVINIKIEELKKADINIQTNIIIPPHLRIDFHQAVTIFGNLLDNAREACAKVSSAERWVNMTLSYINHSLFITVENPLNGRITAWDNQLPVSDKADRAVCGLGLKNVREMAEQNGSFVIDHDAERFRVEIVLYDM